MIVWGCAALCQCQNFYDSEMKANRNFTESSQFPMKYLTSIIPFTRYSNRSTTGVSSLSIETIDNVESKSIL